MVTSIPGEINTDIRGFIMSLNDFHLEGVERTYTIHHPDSSIVRGWHGHQHERKWFHCIRGGFTMAFVKIDDWENPAPARLPEIYHVSDQKSEVICVPEGYANCLKATEDGSILQVWSDKQLPVALLDSWRYPSDNWVDWSKY